MRADEKLAYNLFDAAEAAAVSVDVLRRAVRATASHDAKGKPVYPPPLRAKRNGKGRNARVIVLAEDLKAWHDLFPDA